MLNKSELHSIAKLKGLTAVQVEKDYLQNLLLYFIYSVVGKELIFKGGTCLYKLYNLNRFSEDLDFSVSKHFNFEKHLKKIFFLFQQTRIFVRAKSIERHQNQLTINLEFRGPFFDGSIPSLCFIRLDISLRGTVLLSPERKLLHSIYSDVPSFDVFLMDLREILLEKMLAIYSRKKARDVYDLWFLLKQKNIKIDLALLQKKFKKHKVLFTKDSFFSKIEEQKNNWKKDLTPIISGSIPDFSSIKKDIISVLDTI